MTTEEILREHGLDALVAVLPTPVKEQVVALADALRVAREDNAKMAAVCEAAQALVSALEEVEATHSTRDPNEGEVKHLMGIVTRATRKLEFASRALTPTETTHG